MNNATVTDYPVPGFDMRFTWQTNAWQLLFDEQFRAIENEIVRALGDDRFIVYLSCPISPRGGGDPSTNIAIAKFVTRRLVETWGNRIFVLNPASYQMESKEGRGLIAQHARVLKAEGKLPAEFDLSAFEKQHRPGGGDYMRLWTKVLVGDATPLLDRKRKESAAKREDESCGGLFDAFYFIGPSDVREFFLRRGNSDLTSAVEDHFATTYEIDQEFRQRYDRMVENGADWEGVRDNFVRYYALRCGAHFSKGAHDEWNIWVALNQRRRSHQAYGIGEEIAGFWDGQHVDPAASLLRTSPGYEALMRP